MRKSLTRGQDTSMKVNDDSISQLNTFFDIVNKNEFMYEICRKSSELKLKNCYVGAGFIAQSIWNHLFGYSLTHGINDIDIVYFDEDLSFENEDVAIKKANALFVGYPLKVNLKNQARVHLWHQDHFRYAIKPYRSAEEAINTWPTTATAIGLRLGEDKEWVVYAPFGFNDLLSKIVRANKVQITQEIYESKVKRWISYWPDLKIIPWEA